MLTNEKAGFYGWITTISRHIHAGPACKPLIQSVWPTQNIHSEGKSLLVSIIYSMVSPATSLINITVQIMHSHHYQAHGDTDLTH